MSDLFPVGDGTNVVYSKIAVVGRSGHTTWLHNGTSDSQIAGTTFTDLEQFGGYEVAGGWTAYLRPAVPSPQVWLRSPVGVDRQLTDIGGAQPAGPVTILAVNASGDAVYAVSDTLYLGTGNQSPVPLATGVGAWKSHRLASASNFATYLNGQWNLAIDGSLFVLSTAPPVTLSIAVQGHGTVTVNPYGLVCRASCAVPFAPGARVSVAGVADLPGWTFDAWSGACSGAAVTCDLRLSQASSVSARFVAVDTSGPITTSPVTTLPIGAPLAPAAAMVVVPLRTSWTAFDPDDPVAANELAVSVGGGAFTPVTLPSDPAQTILTKGVSTTRYQFRARARDLNHHVGGWTNGAPFTVDVFAPTTLSYGGDWSFTSPSASWLGTAASTSDPTAAATATVTGQGVAVVARTGHNLAALAIYVDDQLRQVVPTAYTAASSPRIVAAVTLGGGTHTIRIARAASSIGVMELQGAIVLR